MVERLKVGIDNRRKATSYSEGQTWGALRKAWKAYKIAKAENDQDAMVRYAEIVRTLQKELGLHRFSTSGKCEGCGMTQDYYEQAMSVLQGWSADSEKKERMAELKTCSNDNGPADASETRR
jgi:hypothetical protein